jgi:hypothetical protein
MNGCGTSFNGCGLSAEFKVLRKAIAGEPLKVFEISMIASCRSQLLNPGTGLLNVI